MFHYHTKLYSLSSYSAPKIHALAEVDCCC
jgi:hypothetical protein